MCIKYYEEDYDGVCEDGCYICVDETGVPQCTGCRALFSFKRDHNIIIREIIKRVGEECLKEEYERLKSLRKKARERQRSKFGINYSDPELTIINYYDGGSKSKKVRYFYE